MEFDLRHYYFYIFLQLNEWNQALDARMQVQPPGLT